MTTTIIGRSSSHFTRVARIFAHECAVSHGFEPVLDLLSLEAAHYGGNPALRIPTLTVGEEAWFGALNICCELSRRGAREPKIVWPEGLQLRMAVNAQELVLQGMANEVTVVMGSVAAPEAADAYRAKSRQSLINCLSWLEQHLPGVLETLPVERGLSYLEVTAFCFVSHLGFRGVVDMAPYERLAAFAERFGRRESAAATPYCYDRKP
jgi:glutathione S-transferase